MKNAPLSRRLLKKLHIREKATIDHVAGVFAAAETAPAVRVHSAVTASGLCVEHQVRKAARPSPVGLAVF